MMNAWKASARSQWYSFLARAFMPPNRREGLTVPAEVRALWPALSREVQAIVETWYHSSDLLSAYQRLFFGPARPLVDAYESCYRDTERRLAGPWAAQVAALYAEEGLTVDGLLPDHIATELAFMAHLTAQEEAAINAGNEARARRYREVQAAFLRDHLLVWGPSFCKRLAQAAEHPFYAALARWLANWLEEEADRFGLRQTDTVSPAYPMGVKARLCTLCGVCTEVCAAGALRLYWTDGEAQLQLTAEACTGCRLCAEVCPFKALKLGEQPVTGVLVRSPLLPCPECGRPALPEAFWRRITRRLSPSAPAAVAARRCEICRASALLEYERKPHSSQE